MERFSSADRSKQILAVATQVFARSNYQTATTAGIAKEAGISEPLIYRYYSSKKELFLAVLEHVAEQMIKRWNRICEKETSCLRCLRLIGEDYLRLLRENPQDLNLFFKAISENNDPEIASFLSNSYRRYVSYLEQVAEKGLQNGEIRTDLSAKSIAWQMMSIGAANNLFTILALDEWTDEDRQTQLEVFLNNIALPGQ